MDAEPKTDLSSLRGIAISRRKQLDPDKVERHFEAGGQGAEAAYYASVLRELYGEIVGLRDVRIDGKPTGEIKPKRIISGIPDPAPFERQKVSPHTGRHGRSLGARPHKSHQLGGELRGMGSRILRRVVGYAGQVTRETRGRASCQMAEQVWERTHDPTSL